MIRRGDTKCKQEAAEMQGRVTAGNVVQRQAYETQDIHGNKNWDWSLRLHCNTTHVGRYWANRRDFRAR